MSATAFHLTKKGRTAPCSANQRACPLGGEEVHFATAEDAADHMMRQAMERDMAAFEGYGALTDEAMDEIGARDAMRRPATMSDGQWEDFEYWLEEDGVSRHEYESYLAETESTLEREWGNVDHHNDYYRPPRQLVAAVGEYAQEKWKRSVAVPLADELLSRYLNPLQSSIHAEELSTRLIGLHEQAPNGILHDRVTADEVMGSERVEYAVKAFMFDKLWAASGQAA